MKELTEKWEKFRTIVEPYKSTGFRPARQLDKAQLKQMNDLTLSEEVCTLYGLNDGQEGVAKGIFKSASGFDKYTKLFFLNFDQALKFWLFLQTKSELAIFNSNLFPFACDNLDFEKADDVFCVDVISNKVYLLWVAAPDWTLPAEWQHLKSERAANLADFLSYQMNMY